MEPQELDSRISRIETMWTLVREAHQPEERAGAQEVFLRRYTGAIYRYLLGSLKDPNAADEVYQEFALKFVRGAFRNANPERGRFRDFVKKALANLIHDYRRKQGRMPAGLEAESALEASSEHQSSFHDREFVDRWREEVLAKTWAALAEAEQQGKQPYHAVLRYRAANPQATSPEMAAKLSQQLGRPMSEANVRQVLHRAREKFADLLIGEVKRSLESPDEEMLHDELSQLGLLPYCQSALKKKQASSEE